MRNCKESRGGGSTTPSTTSKAADRAFRYLIDYFDDSVNGGAYWSLSSDGSAVDGKKQIYAQAFYIYRLAAYYSLTSNPDALRRAQQYFDLIESRAKNTKFGGYQEAFTQNWGQIADVRLSTKDLNAPKTMNTHLHFLDCESGHLKLADSSLRKGLGNKHQLSTDPHYLSARTGIWRFISAQHIDHAQGEWHAVTCDGGREEQHYKADFCKGPYHNGRAMMEACRRLEATGLT